MSELTFIIIRIAFLVLMWLFILGVIYALKSDLFGVPVRRNKKAGAAAPAAIVAAPKLDPVAPAGQSMPSILPVTAGIPEIGLPDEHRISQPVETPKTLVITEGIAKGTAITLEEDTLTIGRSPDSSLVIVDEYTSTYHAKLQRTGDAWKITDLDSTNGTEVAGQQIHGTVPLRAFTPVKIGTTTFELRP